MAPRANRRWCHRRLKVKMLQPNVRHPKVQSYKKQKQVEIIQTESRVILRSVNNQFKSSTHPFLSKRDTKSINRYKFPAFLKIIILLLHRTTISALTPRGLGCQGVAGRSTASCCLPSSLSSPETTLPLRGIWGCASTSTELSPSARGMLSDGTPELLWRQNRSQPAVSWTCVTKYFVCVMRVTGGFPHRAPQGSAYRRLADLSVCSGNDTLYGCR